MVEWTQLLLPIVFSAVVVFVLSSLMHMVVKWHNGDYLKLPDEKGFNRVMRKEPLPPGQYIFPHCIDPKEAASAAGIEKFQQGPVGVMYVRPSGQMQLGPFLGKWMLFLVVVSVLVAYVARMSLAAGADGGVVFRVTGVVAWLAYSFAGPADSIWMGKPWPVTIKHMIDGLAYGLGTGAMFSWMWPA